MVWIFRPLDRTVSVVNLRVLTRIALGYLALISIEIGAWALIAPRSFYDDFPGLGRAWVSIDGPYNEHLVRDVGALNLALAVLLVVAAVRLTRTLVVTAAAASLVWGAPHLVYHAFNTDGLSNTDLALNLGGLALGAVLPIALIVMARRELTDSPVGTP